MARRKATTSDLLWEEAEEVPRAGMPDARKLEKRQRLYRVVVWTCLLAMPIALIGLLSVAGRKSTPTHTVAQASLDSPGRTAATLEVNQWLAGTPQPLPGGVILSWDGAKTQPKPTVAKSANAGQPTRFSVEIDTFTLLDSQGRTYTACVAVAVDPRGGAAAMGGPSLIANPPAASDDWNTSGPWPGLDTSSTVPDPITQTVNGWAAAYTSGNADQLRLAVGDPSSNDSYMPLSGVKSVTATVTEIASVGKPGDDRMVAQVTLAILWNGQTPPTDANQGQANSAPQTTLDLLIGRASTAAPVVLAWGAPGTGPSLTPYGNAITGGPRPLPSGAQDTPSATTPSPSPSVSTSSTKAPTSPPPVVPKKKPTVKKTK